MRVVYSNLLPPEARREQETTRPSVKLNSTWSRESGPGLITPLTPSEKIARKVHLFAEGQRQGWEAEERFARIFLTFIAQGRSPQWIKDVAYPTPQEEKEKADRIVVTATGHRIPVQIKSSVLGKLKFRGMPKWQHVPCIVVDSEYPDVVIFWVAVDEIAIAHEVLHGQRL